VLFSRSHSADTLVKQSVTELTQKKMVLPPRGKVLQNSGTVPARPFDDSAGGAKFGTQFHKQMQYGELPEIINGLLSGFTVYKELPFLSAIYTNGTQTLVQGIIDLLAVKGKDIVIIDYKTTRADEAELIGRYASQLRLYAEAVAKSLLNCNIKTYIYSAWQERLIEI
jgi:ATP-dependent exoDNAse (exonuclease V) beta subunit